jgi:flagellar hook-basal body complex protein FliE
MAPILPVNLPIPAIAAPAAVASVAGTAGGSAFQSVLTDAISQVENFSNIADASVNSFLSGEGDELHQVAIKTQQASLSFDLFLQVRNKIVAAYTSVMNMQV